MSQDIKPGDTVMVVRGLRCCGNDGGHLGLTYVVSGVEMADATCAACGAPILEDVAFRASDEKGALVSMLKKLPPLTEDESNETRQDIEVPA